MKEKVQPIEIKQDKVGNDIDAALYIVEVYLQPVFEEIQELLKGLDDDLKKNVKDVFDQHITELAGCGDLIFSCKDHDALMKGFSKLKINSQRVKFAQLFFQLNIIQFKKKAEAGDTIPLTNDQGVVKTILMSGDDSEPPVEGQEVLINYEGRLEDGTVFESTFGKEFLKVTVGVDQVIKGWDIGLMSMKLGEYSELRITPEYGYGKIGSPKGISGGEVLIFKIKLVQINDSKPSRSRLSDEELI